METDGPQRTPYEGRFMPSGKGKTWIGTPTCDVATYLGKTESNLLISLEGDRSGKPDADLLYCDAPDGLTGSRMSRMRRTKLVSHRCVKWMIQTCRSSDKAGWEAIEAAFPFKRRQSNGESDHASDGNENGRADQANAFDDEEVPAEPQAPVVYNKDRETLTTSLAVARSYGKEHKNVLAAIEAIILEMGLKLSREFVFRKTIYIAGNGRAEPMYEMNEDAFSLLVGGFTGAEALRFRIAYITEFKRMRKALEDHASMSDDDILARGYLLAHERYIKAEAAIETEWKPKVASLEMEKAKEEEARLQAEDMADRERIAREAAETDKAKMAPKAEYFDDLVERAGLYSYSAAAKMLEVGRSYLITILFNPPLGWHFRYNGKGELQPHKKAITDRYMAVQSRSFTNRKTGEPDDKETARITEKGIEFLRQYLKRPFKLVS